MASCNTVVQAIVDERMRGRVMSMYMMTWSGLLPIGNLTMGWLADTTTASLTVTVMGCVLLIVFIAFRRTMFAQRPVIERAFAEHKVAEPIPPNPSCLNR